MIHATLQNLTSSSNYALLLQIISISAHFSIEIVTNSIYFQFNVLKYPMENRIHDAIVIQSIVNPMDLSLIKLKTHFYNSFNEFYVDICWIVHNAIVLFSGKCLFDIILFVYTMNSIWYSWVDYTVHFIAIFTWWISNNLWTQSLQKMLNTLMICFRNIRNLFTFLHKTFNYFSIVHRNRFL